MIYKKALLIAFLSLMFGSGWLYSDLNKEPKESVVNHEIELVWMEFNNGLIKDIK